MIADIHIGESFEGVVRYAAGKEGARVIATNMAGQTVQEWTAEFNAVRKLRPNLRKAVAHVSLSAAPGEHLSDAQWRKIARRYLRRMGFTHNQYVVTRHTDTEHEHVHLVINRVTPSGGVVSDSQNYRRQEAVMREIEREFGLRTVLSSRAAPRKAAKKGEIEHSLRTGQPSTRQQLCDAAAQGCDSFTGYVERLEAVGVALIPVVQLGGAKLSGVSYRLDGTMMKGSDLGRSYAAAGIQKRGISYEQDRDAEAVRRCLQREATRAFDAPDRGGASGEGTERRGTGRAAGAAGAGDGRADRRDVHDLAANRPTHARTGAGVLGAVADGDAGVPPEHGPGAQGGGRLGTGGADRPAPASAADDRDRPVEQHRDGGARERIVALGGAADPDVGDAGHAGGGEPVAAPTDRSLQGVRRQLSAWGVERVVVGLRSAGSGLMMQRVWTLAEVEQSMAWLRRRNARGDDIYVRPADGHGLVLLDDLTPDALAQMARAGYAPAALTETSPGNFQAWVKLSDAALSAEVRTRAARGLAQRFGGDLNSADAEHFGRLAGFTNRKPKHTTAEGRQPYVLAHGCPGTVAAMGPALVRQIADALEPEAVRHDRRQSIEAIEAAPPSGADPVAEYRRQAQRLLRQYGPKADLSRVDWMAATAMARSGRFGQADIARAIEQASPNVDSRKAGHVSDYARRTAEKAWAEGATGASIEAGQAQRARAGTTQDDTPR